MLVAGLTWPRNAKTVSKIQSVTAHVTYSKDLGGKLKGNLLFLAGKVKLCERKDKGIRNLLRMSGSDPIYSPVE